MLEQDYIMRMIHEMVRTIIKLVLGIDMDKREKELDDEASETAEVYRKLKAMIKDGNINEAENVLFDQIDYEKSDDFSMALMFYLQLNDLDNDTLEQYGYSREEIIEGIQTVAKGYGYEEVVSPLVKIL